MLRKIWYAPATGRVVQAMSEGSSLGDTVLPGCVEIILDLPPGPDPLYIVDGAPVYAIADLPTEVRAQVEAEALTLARAAAIRRIDREAEDRRGLIVTPGTGQMAVYQAKEAEARCYAQDQAPDPADYPFLAAEAAATGKTMAVQAGIILAMAQAWRLYGAAIEGVRLGAKRAVGEAADQAAIAAVLAGLAWPAVPAGA